MKLLRSLALLFLLALLAPGPACSRSDPAADGGTAIASALPAVPAPPGLIVEIVMPTPDVSWGKTRGVVGGPAAFLPQSFGGLAATLLGLPITITGEIDGAIPVVGAVVDAGADAPPRGAIGIHVRAGERFIDQLTKGDGARFKARADAPSSIVLLDGKDGAKGPTALGVLGNYLLVAKTEADLLAVGPYVARSLPLAWSQKPLPTDDLVLDVPRAAMAGPVRAWIAKATGFLREQPAGESPASYLIAPLVTALDVASDASSARLTVHIDEGAVRLKASLTPNAEAGPAQAAATALVIGDAKPILALPGKSVATVLMRESAASRASSAARQGDALGAVLGKQLSAADREAIVATLTALAEARGDWIVGGLSFGGAGPAAYFRGAVADPDKLTKAMKDLVALTRRPSLKAGMAEGGFSVSAGKSTVQGLGEVDRIRFERVVKEGKPRAEPGLPTSVDLLYSVTKEAMLLAAGLDAKDALATLANAPGKADLTSNPGISAAVQSLGGDVAVAAVLEPLRLVAARAGKPDAGESAPVVLALGRGAADGSPSSLWLRVDVANPAIRELVKHHGAF